MTGTSYGIIGPWANGITQVVLDSGFNAERWYEFIAEAPRHGLVFGAHRHPPADERRKRDSRASTTCRACAIWPAWASRSMPRR